jgi:hypothetical protein
MTTRVLAARSENAASRALPRIAITDETQRLLFKGGHFHDLSLINRLADPYRDATYFHQELPTLEHEVRTLAERFVGDSRLSAFLQDFLRVCRDAINGGLDLYCHAE